MRYLESLEIQYLRYTLLCLISGINFLISEERVLPVLHPLERKGMHSCHSWWPQVNVVVVNNVYLEAAWQIS